jgi:hypothetical protein
MGSLRFKTLGIILAITLIGCGQTVNLTSISVSPSSATVGILKIQRFYATAYDQTGKIFPTAISWSVTGGIGTIDAQGIFYAGDSELTGGVVASAQGKSASASVKVTTKGSISGVIKNTDAVMVSGINVYLAAYPNLSSFSDSSGRYAINEVPYGTWEVKTSQNVLYTATSQTIAVLTAESLSLNITIPYRFSIENESFNGTPITSITGTVRNNGSTEAKSVTITYTFYDDTGGIIDVAIGYAGDIPAGGANAFSAIPSSSIDSYYSKTRTVSAGSF